MSCLTEFGVVSSRFRFGIGAGAGFPAAAAAVNEEDDFDDLRGGRRADAPADIDGRIPSPLGRSGPGAAGFGKIGRSFGLAEVTVSLFASAFAALATALADAPVPVPSSASESSITMTDDSLLPPMLIRAAGGRLTTAGLVDPLGPATLVEASP